MHYPPFLFLGVGTFKNYGVIQANDMDGLVGICFAYLYSHQSPTGGEGWLFQLQPVNYPAEQNLCKIQYFYNYDGSGRPTVVRQFNWSARSWSAWANW